MNTNKITGSLFSLCLFGLLVSAGAIPGLADVHDLADHGGPVMRARKVFLIFWLPKNHEFDPSAHDGVGNYENVIERFFSHVGETRYFNVVTQYPGACGLDKSSSQECTGKITAQKFLDTDPYPKPGTRENPLRDSDIRDEVRKMISKHGLDSGLDTAFFVFTGNKVEECDGQECTFNSFCAYHGEFQLNGKTVIYAFMPRANVDQGCDANISKSPNGQISSDREVVFASHELIEAVTDPTPDSDAGWFNGVGGEIGDLCNPDGVNVIGHVRSDGSNVTLNGLPFVVQAQWSNNDEKCVLGFHPALSGPTVEFKIRTGADDLRGDSSATGALKSTDGTIFQSLKIKTQDQPSWDDNTTHVRVFDYAKTKPSSLGNVSVTLSSHNSFLETNDNWNIHIFDVVLRDHVGNTECQLKRSGLPLVRLTGDDPTATFPATNCQPAPQPGELFNQIQFRIITGDDDLRDDSSATATLNQTNGITRTFTLKAKDESDWQNNSEHTRTFALLADHPLSAFETITIKMTSHNSFPETNDNWNIQSLNVIVSKSGNDPACLVSLSGNPFKRLTGDDPSVTVDAGSGCQ